MAKALIVANWKMNPPTFREAKELFEATRQAVEKSKRTSIIVAPPSIFLRELSASYRGRTLTFAVQHAHYEEHGAHTGEISMVQAHDAKATAVIIGHAERRAFGETNEDTRKKVAAALSFNMTPILCVGEETRTVSGEYFNVVKDQLRAGFGDVPDTRINRVTVVYEPLWTIGKETTMSPRQMHEMAIFMRKTMVNMYGEKGIALRILYGGSVDEENALAMLSEGDVLGFLVGRASADAEKFAGLLGVIG